MEKDMMSDCKYTSPEICRAPLLLTLEKVGAGVTAMVDGTAVANFGFGSHFLRKYFYHSGGAQSMQVKIAVINRHIFFCPCDSKKISYLFGTTISVKNSEKVF